MRNAQLKLFANGYINPMKGKKMSEEKRHERAQALKKRFGKPIVQCDKNGNIIKEFETITDGAISLGITTGDIGAVLSGRIKQTHGMYFKYKNQ